MSEPAPPSARPRASAEAVERWKRAAAREAVERVTDGMVLGLGTGSTVAHVLEGLGRRLADGTLRDVVGVPTSVRTAEAARVRGIPLTTLEEHPVLDLAVDGADEIGPDLDLIKGMGGALLREKVVAQAARRFLVVADERKVVEGLGLRSPLPVEVIPFGWSVHAELLRSLGATVARREGEGGEPYTTDNGNNVLDCRFDGGIDRPPELDARLRARAGIVETGLFLGLAHEALIGGEDGVRRLSSGSE